MRRRHESTRCLSCELPTLSRASQIHTRYLRSLAMFFFRGPISTKVCPLLSMLTLLSWFLDSAAHMNWRTRHSHGAARTVPLGLRLSSLATIHHICTRASGSFSAFIHTIQAVAIRLRLSCPQSTHAYQWLSPRLSHVQACCPRNIHFHDSFCECGKS